MNENLVTVKTAIVAGCTALGAFLGWKGVMLIAWTSVEPDVDQRLNDAVIFEGYRPPLTY